MHRRPQVNECRIFQPRTFLPWTFRLGHFGHLELPKMDDSAIIIKCIFECIDLGGSKFMCVGGSMYMCLHACMHCACMCDAINWFSS